MMTRGCITCSAPAKLSNFAWPCLAAAPRPATPRHSAPKLPAKPYWSIELPDWEAPQYSAFPITFCSPADPKFSNSFFSFFLSFFLSISINLNCSSLLSHRFVSLCCASSFLYHINHLTTL